MNHAQELKYGGTNRCEEGGSAHAIQELQKGGQQHNTTFSTYLKGGVSGGCLTSAQFHVRWYV